MQFARPAEVSTDSGALPYLAWRHMSMRTGNTINPADQYLNLRRNAKLCLRRTWWPCTSFRSYASRSLGSLDTATTGTLSLIPSNGLI